MKRFCGGLLFLVAAALCAPSLAGSLVTAPKPYAKAEVGGAFASTFSLYAPETFSHRSFVTRSSDYNRVNWEFTDQTDEFERLTIAIGAISAYEPEHQTYGCGRDGTCGYYTVPEEYSVSFVTVSIPLVTTKRLYARVALEGAGVRGLPHFAMSYFDRIALYAADLENGAIHPQTTLAPDPTTDDPFDVLNFVDGVWIPAGNHLLEFEVESGYLTPQELFSGHARIVVEFSTVPEPGSIWYVVVAASVAVLRWRGGDCA